MEWPTSEISEWDKFVRMVSLLGRKVFPTPYVFRGQANSAWSLKPSLLRLLPSSTQPARAIEIEWGMLEDFKSQAHLHVPAGLLPPSLRMSAPAEWWALMQHYGAPTRLLDWTQSAYVAAYFAVESGWDTDGVLYAVHMKAAQGSYEKAYGPGGIISPDEFKRADAPKALLFWCPERRSTRFVAQQGFTSLSTSVSCSHDDMILESCDQAQSQFPEKMIHHRLIIPRSSKPQFLRNLRAMNIAAHSLFPGLEGTCRSAAEHARLAFTGDEPKEKIEPESIPDQPKQLSADGGHD